MNAPLVEHHCCVAHQLATRVLVLVADGVSLTTVSLTLEPFQQANAILGWEKFTLLLISLTDKDPTTSAGITIPCQSSYKDVLDPRNISDSPDLAIICCGQSLDSRERVLMQKFTRKLARAHVPFYAMGAACAAAAATGLIRGGKCAAHWKIIAPLEELFPDIEFENVLFASDGKVTSCAGELASFDLIVGFIEWVCGSRISGEICNHFLASGKRSGDSVQLLSGDALICQDSRFQQALRIMVDNIETPISIRELARRIGLSTRQVERIFARHGFGSPLKYYNKLRIQRGHQLIEQTRMSLIEIALACGFESRSSFSNNYKRVFGISPKANRDSKASAGYFQVPPSAGDWT